MEDCNYFLCTDHTCSTTTCEDGYTLCGGSCEKDPGVCCANTWYAGKECCSAVNCEHFQCTDNTCSTTKCEDGYTLCGLQCKLTTDGVCCTNTWYAGGACCTPADCEHFLCTDHACSTTDCEVDFMLCNGQCVELSGPNGACTLDCHCQENLKCAGTKCKKVDGQACTSWSECASGVCVDDSCDTCGGNDGTACIADGVAEGKCCGVSCLTPLGLDGGCDGQDCMCLTNLKCTDDECKYKNGEACTDSDQCASGLCDSLGKCGTLTTGSTCMLGGNPSGSVCNSGCCAKVCDTSTEPDVCGTGCATAGATCYESVDGQGGLEGKCCNGLCFRNVERHDVGDSCTLTCECVVGLECSGEEGEKTCKRAAGVACTSGTECISEVCVQQIPGGQLVCGTCEGRDEDYACDTDGATSWCCLEECTAPLGIDGACTADCHCNENLKCTGNKCKKKDGQACTSYTGCASGECIRDPTSGDRTCGTCEGKDTSYNCTTQAATGWCCNDQCAEPRGLDGTCNDLSCMCGAGFDCTTDGCKSKDGEACTDSSKCASKLCDETGACGTPTTGNKCMVGGQPSGSVCDSVCCSFACDTGTVPATCGMGCAIAGATCYKTVGGQGGYEGKCCNNECVRETERVDVGHSCALTCQCVTSLQCAGPEEDKTCRQGAGVECISWTECVSEVCVPQILDGQPVCGTCEDKDEDYDCNTDGAAGWCCLDQCIAPVGLDGDCIADCHCNKNLECTDGKCKKVAGQDCATASVCASGMCVAGTCGTCAGKNDITTACKTATIANGWCCNNQCIDPRVLDGACTADCQCQADMECAVDKCKKEDGQACTTATECSSGMCIAGTCGTCAGKNDITTACKTATIANGWCCNNQCIDPRVLDGACTADCQCRVDLNLECAVDKCKKEDGQECATGPGCASGVCVNAACGTCEGNDGRTCTREGVAEGRCCAGTCSVPGDVDAACTADCDCLENMQCVDEDGSKKCRKDDGQACTDSGQCASKLCDSNAICDNPLTGEKCILNEQPSGTVCNLACCANVCDTGTDPDTCAAGCATDTATCYETVGTQGGMVGKCCGDKCVRAAERVEGGEPCTLTCQCATGLVCTGLDGAKTCKKAAGGPCTVWSDCASSVCVQGTPGGDDICGTCEGKDATYACKAELATGWCCLGQCFAPLGLDKGCTDDCHCDAGFQCIETKCKRSNGQDCTTAAECASGMCIGGECGTCIGKADVTTTCKTATIAGGWCCTGQCIVAKGQDGACQENCDCTGAFLCTAAGNKCKLKEGEDCSKSADCVLKLCSLDSVCNGNLVAANQCYVDKPTLGTVCQDICCGLPKLCLNDQCVDVCGAPGATCYEGAAVEGVCCEDECYTPDERRVLNAACTADCQCKTELSCTGGKCLYKDGNECTSWSECVSGLCIDDGGTYKCGRCTAGNTEAACKANNIVDGWCCDNACRDRQGLNTVCGHNCYCKDGYQCKNGLCKIKEGKGCERSADCANIICSASTDTCNAGLTPPSQCHVQPGTKGTACEGQCCGEPNYCFNDQCVDTCDTVWMRCHEGAGVEGICCQQGCWTTAERNGVLTECAANCECKDDSLCTDQLCRLKDDKTCSAGNQCSSGVCIKVSDNPVSLKCGDCGATTTRKTCSDATGLTGLWCCLDQCVAPQGLDGACTTDCHCKNTLQCVGPEGNMRCKRENGQACNTWSECIREVCVDNVCGVCSGNDLTTCNRDGVADGWCCGDTCVAPRGLDGACNGQACMCDTGLDCTDNGCKYTTEHACTESGQCASKLCDETEKCGTPTTGSKCMLGGNPSGSVCNDICCADICNTGTTPYTCDNVCATAGETCYESAGGQGGQQGKCCNNKCVRQVEKGGVNVACAVDCECDETDKLECTNGVCKIKSGQPCTLGSQCGTNVCVGPKGAMTCGECTNNMVSCQSGDTEKGWCCNEACIDPVPLNGVCISNCNCQGNNELTCSFGIGLCKLTGGQGCTRSTDCDSKACASATATCAQNPTKGDVCRVDVTTNGLFCSGACCNGFCDSDADACAVCQAGHACNKLVEGERFGGICCANQCYLTAEKKEYESDCTEHCECGVNLECAVATDRKCRLATGQGCTNGKACASGVCVGNICGTCVGKTDVSTGCMTPDFSDGWCCAGACASPKETGEDCAHTCECKTGMQCVGNKCKKNDGQACTDSGQCASGICRIDGTCGAADTGLVCKIGDANIGTVCGPVCCNAICDVGLNLCSTNTCVEGHQCFEDEGAEGSCCMDACYTPDELLLLEAGCGKSCQCQSTLSCTGGAEGSKCKLKNGQACTGGAECSSGVCVTDSCGTCEGKGETIRCKTATVLEGWCCNGACVSHGGLDRACTANCQCKDEFSCSGLLCKLRNGQECLNGEDCASKVCVDDACGSCVGKSKTSSCDTENVAGGWCCADECVSPGELGETCAHDCQCKDQYRCEGYMCKKKDDQECTSGGQCASGVCTQQTAGGSYVCGSCMGKTVDSQCKTGTIDDGWCCAGLCIQHKGQDEGCTVDCNCDPIYSCTENRCKKKDEQACTSAGECSVGQCVATLCRTCTGIPDFTACKASGIPSGKCCNNICTAPRGLGDGCALDCQCGATMECINGACKKAAGQPCTSGDQCGTGLCVSAPGGSICGTCNTDDFTSCKTVTISDGWCCGGECVSPQALDGPCDSYCQCHQNFACTDTGIGKKCKLKKGQTCTLSTDCTSGVCLSNGQCDQAAVGTSCKITAGIEGSVCGNAWAWDTCCAKICDAGTTQCAMTCTESNTCYEGAGIQGECCTSTCITAAEKGGLNAPCGKNCVCDQNSFTCVDTYGGANVDTCKKLNGQECESGRDCASKVCVDGTCGTCMGMLAKTPCSTDVLAQGWCCNNQCIYAKPINSQCQRNCECNVGMECHNGLCKLSAAETCTSAALCASGQCVSSGIYTCGTCAVDGVGCLDENGVLKQCCSSLCNVGWKGVTEPCGNDCECATNMKCAGNPRTCKYVDGQPCTHGNQCQSGYCVDKTGNGGWRCGTCDAAEDNGNLVINHKGTTGVCCVGNQCTPICRDGDGNGQVDTCNSCEGMAQGSLCYTVAGEGECCNNNCYTEKLPSGQLCGKDCECEAGFCDRNTHVCTDLAGEGAQCISDADCQAGLTCIDTDENGRLDSCSTCNKHGAKKCQEDILSGYCCGGTCKGMLYLSWFPEAECGENPCDGQVKCIAGDWKCNTAGQYKCFQDQSSTCTQTGIFNTGQAAKCVPYKCDGTTGKCRTACVSNDHCLTSYSCIDLTTDGVPEACDTCTGHEASVCDLGGKTGFCCGDTCKAPPVAEWTPANRCGEQDCNGAVKCEDGSWACDTYGDPVCSPELTLRGQCSNVGAFSSLGDCSPYTCDPTVGQCRTVCATSVDCQTQFPCIDIDGQPGLDRCASCSAFGAAACEHLGTSGHCCGNGCEAMSSDQWNPGGGCGLNQCDGGRVTCRESEWLCDTFERHVCNDGRTRTTLCSKLGEYDIPNEDSCGSYICDPTVGTCMTGCSSDIHCTSQCCVLGSCVEKKTKGEGESCEKDCECGGNSVCDPGTKKCSKAVTCPNGQVRNCDASKPICVDDPLKDWLCKPECIPDEAPCVTETVRGFCCKGECISPRPGFFPGKDCGRLDCGGDVGCNLTTGELTCNSFGGICCDSNAPGMCNEVGDCQATRSMCANQCGGGGSRTFLNYTCHTGLCEALSSDCSEFLFQCNPDRGCVECLDDSHCDDQCQRYSFLNYTCQNHKCEILGADIQDCSTGGSNQICQLPTGCIQCISTEQCQAQYGANYACDFQTLGCKVAKCFKDDNCPYTCEQNIYRGQSCDNYVCRDKPEQDCKADGMICTRKGCVDCASDVNCTLTYGTDFGCKGGRCEMLCGNGKCDEGEDCNYCPQDCQCKETETCDPTTTWAHGCAPDFDNDGFADDKDPCPRDPKNACKPCQGDKDCTDMCHQNAHIEFSCQISVCTPGTEVSCAEMGLICDPAARCVRCGNMTDSNKACKTVFEFTYICAEDRCLPDRDMDGMPDSEDPCPTDPTNACTAECPNEVCEATEDCNTCPEDCGCDDGNPCSVDRCILGQCIYEAGACGSACETGVCDGDSACMVRSSGGGDCFCEGMCEKGYTCDHSQKCAKAECGDGKCQNECGQCPQDCSIKDCLNNGVCDTSMGENCAIAPKDCSCMPGFTCDSLRPESNEIGCYRVACGDTHCDSPDETAGTCCVDCECPGDQKCDPETNSCRGGCGDGECEPATECDSCRVDCTPADCIDRKCAPGIGETCRNSADCICDAEIESESTIEMVEKQTKILSFTVKNTGSLRDAFDIILEGDPTMVGLAWTKRLKVNIDVNATFPLSVDVQGQIPGSHVLIINAVPRGLPNKTIIRKVVVAVEQESVLEQIGVLANIKDVIEVIVIIGALFLAVKRRFFPGDVVPVAAQGAWQQQQPANYYANQYYGGGGGGYYGQSGAWRAMPANNAQWGGQAGGWGQGQATQAPAQQAAPPPKKEEPKEELSDAAWGLHPGSVSGPSTPGKGLHPGDDVPTSGPKAKKTEEEEDLDYRGFHP